MTISVTELLDPKESNASSVEFHYVKADFIAASQLYAAPTRRVWILLLMSVLILAAAIFAYSREISQPIAVVAIMSVAGAMMGALVQFYVYLPWRARRNFAKSPLSRLEYKFTLLSEGIMLQNARGISRLQWNDFLRWRTNKKTTLVFLSPTTCIHFPARLAELGFPVHRLKVELSRRLGLPF